MGRPINPNVVVGVSSSVLSALLVAPWSVILRRIACSLNHSKGVFGWSDEKPQVTLRWGTLLLENLFPTALGKYYYVGTIIFRASLQIEQLTHIPDVQFMRVKMRAV